jgi:hypothetical protein
MGFEPKLRVPGRKQPQSWEAYRAEVERHGRSKGGNPSPVPLTDETRKITPLVSPAPDDVRCQHVKKRDGIRCKSYAMKGARFCVMHGGARDNPAHPHAARLLLSGALDAWKAERDAWAEMRRHPAREAAQAALRPYLKAPSGPLIRDAIQAMQADDDGKAWRRLVQEIKAGGRK